MKKMGKISKLFLLLIFSFVLAVATFEASAEQLPKIDTDNAAYDVQKEDTINDDNMNLIQNDVRVDDLDIEPISTKEVEKNVVPDTKKEGKKVIALFLKSMIMVLICALLLYFLLSVIKRNWGEAFKEEKFEEEFEALDLAIPKTKIEALKSFLNRTR